MEGSDHVGVSRIGAIDCIFKFDEEIEDPNFFVKGNSRQSQNLQYLDHKTFMGPKHLFFNLKTSRV